MNTNQLLKCIREDPVLNQQCAGVHPINLIPAVEGYPFCSIVNLDTSNRPGSHWVAVYIDQDRNGEFFDSYGRKPHRQPLLKFLKKNCSHWDYNDQLLQSPYSSVCGQHCLFYLYHRTKGDTMQDILSRFSPNLEQNDCLVASWVNVTFDVDTDVFDVDFMINQVCRALLVK